MHTQVSEEDLKKMLDDVDEDGTGEIEFVEFCKLMGIDVDSEEFKGSCKSCMYVCMFVYIYIVYIS